MRDPKERLRDILEAIAAIDRYRDRDRSAFDQDEMLQVWFLQHLQIIGEAARRLPEEIRNLAPDIPWHKIIGMRNILVHGYFAIDLDVVWDAVQRDVPLLKPAVEALLKNWRTKAMAGEWREIALWDIAEYINGRATKPSELASNGVPVIKIAELNRGITEETDRIPPELVEEKHWVSPGDLLFAWSGSVGIYRYAGPKAALNQHIFRVVAKPGIDQGFLRYLLLSCVPLFQLHVQDKRTTMGHVTKKDLQRIRVRIPPLQEQRAIAHILGTLDDKIELNRRMSETLEAMARALFKAWFVDFEPVRAKTEGRWQRGQSLSGLPAHLYDLFPDRLVDSELGEIPEGWEVGTLADHFDAVKGVSYKGSSLSNSGVPLHNLNSIYEGGGYKYEGIKFYAGEYSGRHIVRPGDVIVANTEQGHDRLLIGYAAIVPRLFGDHGIVSHHIYRLRPKPDGLLPSTYLCHLLNSPQMHDIVSGYANGTTVNMLPIDAVQKLKIVCPPPEVVAAFDALATNVEHRREEIVAESRTLAALRDALLPKLIRGEIRVKDAEQFLKERGL
jgi:type I restriction enzyme S subunit